MRSRDLDKLTVAQIVSQWPYMEAEDSLPFTVHDLVFRRELNVSERGSASFIRLKTGR
jgi:hypothetical protein